MSLSKQLLVLITLLFFLLFGVNIALSISNIKTYIEDESLGHAQDTATSLGLSLSPYLSHPDDPMLKTMANAIFDMGYYSEIRLLDAQNRELIKLQNTTRVEGVPDWFIEHLPMMPATAQSEISSGWTRSGTVWVTVNSGLAYRKLFNQTKASLFYASLTFVAAMILVAFILRMSFSSLRRLDGLAQDIADGRFVTISPLPWTTEIRNLALSMNSMSGKIAARVKQLNQELETLGSRLLCDEITGLLKKTVFDNDLNRILSENTPAFLVLIKLDALAALSKQFDNHRIDQLLQNVANALTEEAENRFPQQARLYRFYGGELAALVTHSDQSTIEAFVSALSNRFERLGADYGTSDLAHIGVSGSGPLSSADSLLETAREAYEQARLIQRNGYFVRPPDAPSRDISAWKTLVYDCVEQGRYAAHLEHPIFDHRTGGVIMEDAFVDIHDSDGTPIKTGVFVSIAEKYSKIIELDRGMIQRVTARIHEHNLQHAIAVTIASRTLKSVEFRNWLAFLLKTDERAAQQLVFTSSAYAVAQDLDAHGEFFHDIRRQGGRVMIKRYETQSLTPEHLRQLKPDFIRLSRDISHTIHGQNAKQHFVRTLNEWSTLLDITLLAESVESELDIETLKRLGVAGASRN